MMAEASDQDLGKDERGNDKIDESVDTSSVDPSARSAKKGKKKKKDKKGIYE